MQVPILSINLCFGENSWFHNIHIFFLISFFLCLTLGSYLFPSSYSAYSNYIPSSPAYCVFISQLIRYARVSSSYECFILRAVRLSNKLLGQGCVKERLGSSLRKFYGRYGDLIKQSEVSPLPKVTRHSGWWPSTVTPSIDQALHQFLTLLQIWTLLPNMTFNLIARGFHRTFATGAACQQRTLTPPETWSCPTLGLASVLLSRPIAPELDLSPDFWVLNIPLYFCFLLHSNDLLLLRIYNMKCSLDWSQFDVCDPLQTITINGFTWKPAFWNK